MYQVRGASEANGMENQQLVNTGETVRVGGALLPKQGL